MKHWMINLGPATVANGHDSSITYTFSANTTSSPQVYTISYTSDTNCTASTTYTVPACSLNSFTVYSDVEGASVSWSNGSTGTITGGTCTINVGGYDSLTATLSKNGVSFEHNGSSCSAGGWVLITNAADYVTINGVDWATKNLGQNSITGIGSTYTWGATTECSWGSAWDSGYDITTDRSNHDIAYIQSSGNLAIPTLNDINSLGTSTTDDYPLTINGVNGVLFVDRNSGPTYGNSVYIPVGFYWTTFRHEYGTDIGDAEFWEVQEEGGTWNGNEAITNCNLIRPIKYTATVCNCNEFSVTGNTNITYTPGAQFTAATYTAPDCQGSISVNSFGADWATTFNCGGGKVVAQIFPDRPTPGSDTGGTITLTWTDGLISCTKSSSWALAFTGCQKCFELGTHNGMFLLRANEYTKDVPSVLYYHGSENIELVYSAIRANNGVCFTLNSTGYSENTPYVLEIVNSNGELGYTDDDHEHEYGYVDDEYIIVYIAYMNQIQGGYSFNVNTYEPYTPHLNDCQ